MFLKEDKIVLLALKKVLKKKKTYCFLCFHVNSKYESEKT